MVSLNICYENGQYCNAAFGLPPAPKIFELMFAFLKPILTGNTLSKVKVFGSNSKEWKQTLFEHIDPDELPADYGGNNTSVPLVSV